MSIENGPIDFDGDENFKECYSAGIEGDEVRLWSPVMFVFLLMKDESGEAGIYRASLKRMALKTGMDIASINQVVMHLVGLGALKVIPNEGLKITLNEDEVASRLL